MRVDGQIPWSQDAKGPSFSDKNYIIFRPAASTAHNSKKFQKENNEMIFQLC